MDTTSLTGRTILIVESDVERAAPMQDRIVDAGGRVLTAYSLSRALLIARNADLDDALIDFQFGGAETVGRVLKERHVPHIFYCGEGMCCSSVPAIGVQAVQAVTQSAAQAVQVL